MPVLKWDKVGDRTYESGLDRGVLYLMDGSAVPWNGLTSVEESISRSVDPIFYDGAKIGESIKFGTFAATLSAITYPDEFDLIEGREEIRSGVLLGDQAPQKFGLCYRTRVGNDVDGDSVSYKIHLIYNITAIPSNRTYASQSDELSLVEFEWELTTTPVDVDGFRGASHITLNTADMDPMLLSEIERMIYGDSGHNASLIPMDVLVSYINHWFIIEIVDNGDGTWSAYTKYDDYIFELPGDLFRIDNANVVYISDHEFVISDTRDHKDSAEIAIIDHGDGTWTATSSNPEMIVVSGTTFEIRNANVETVDADTYILSDTI